MSFGHSFLADPETFPAHDEGETWGNSECLIEVAGTSYLFQGLNETQVEHLQSYFAQICRLPDNKRTTTPLVVTQVFRAAPALFKEPATAPEPYSFDLDPQESRVDIAGLRLMGRFHLGNTKQGYLWTSESHNLKWFSRVVILNYLRVLFAYQARERGGVILHSAGVIDNGKAHIFLGKSGAGKSTLSQLSLNAGRSLLSDDLNLVYPENDQIIVEKLPFSGQFSQAPEPSIKIPLGRFYRLEQAPAHTMSPLPKSQVFAQLLTNAPFINKDTHRLPELMQFLHFLADEYPGYTLQFSLKENVWSTIHGEAA